MLDETNELDRDSAKYWEEAWRLSIRQREELIQRNGSLQLENLRLQTQNTDYERIIEQGYRDV